MEGIKAKKPGGKREGQKYKSLLVWDILLKKTDENHALKLKDIKEHLPIKIQTFHRKNTPVHWGNFYPIKQECSLTQQKTFIGSKVSVRGK